MRVFKRFAFWLFLFSSLIMLIEFTANPVKDLFFIDQLFSAISKEIDIYDMSVYQLTWLGGFIYILLYTCYGLVLDFCIYGLKKHMHSYASK